MAALAPFGSVGSAAQSSSERPPSTSSSCISPWILDSDAFFHTTSDSTSLTSIRPLTAPIIVQTADGTLVGTGPRRHDSQRLWELDWLHLPSATPASLVASTVVAASATASTVLHRVFCSVALSFGAQWHYRLGHLCGSRLSSLLHRGLLGSVSGDAYLNCQCLGYKVKTRSDGFLERYKARLVARGFQQEYGHDYDEIFAHVAHMTTVRILLAVASVRAWSISQLDVNNIFLNGELCEEVYMQPPLRYSVLEGMYITFFKERLNEQFLMSDLGPLRYFLGVEVISMLEGFYLSQEKYIQDLLDRASLTDQHIAETPMELNVHLRPTDGEPLIDPTRYRHLVGSLVYLGVTRPDISYPIHILSHFVFALTQLHYIHLLRVLRYLRGTITRHLFFPRSRSLQLQAYYDATWASDNSNRQSLSTYCVFLGSSLIAWKTKKQTTVSHLSAEAELRAMALLTVEVTWLQWLLENFGVSVSAPTPLLSDSTGAISIATNPLKHELTKYIGVDASYMRTQVQDQVVALQYVPLEL
uniref:PH01B019A14.4 protein n=1 Tax=Phyllostachys edulis TaxID=38705 RepID=L0P211_PHYED|nr:PH01B019A14.4 [Phyllostachys edulis]